MPTTARRSFRSTAAAFLSAAVLTLVACSANSHSDPLSTPEPQADGRSAAPSHAPAIRVSSLQADLQRDTYPLQDLKLEAQIDGNVSVLVGRAGLSQGLSAQPGDIGSSAIVFSGSVGTGTTSDALAIRLSECATGVTGHTLEFRCHAGRGQYEGQTIVDFDSDRGAGSDSSASLHVVVEQ